MEEYKKNIIDNAMNRPLVWWTTLPMGEQVRLGHEYRNEVSFNLSIRDVCFIHDEESKKLK